MTLSLLRDREGALTTLSRLEVRYAWGKGIPTVLLARDAADLRFDVKSQRCPLYDSIRKLEESLTRELQALLD